MVHYHQVLWARLHTPSEYHADSVLHRQHSKVELLVVSLLWEDCRVPFGAMRASLQGGGIWSSSRSGISGPCFWNTWCLQEPRLTFHFFGVTKGNNSNRPYVLGVSWANNKRGLSCPVLRFLLSDFGSYGARWWQHQWQQQRHTPLIPALDRQTKGKQMSVIEASII